MHTDRSQLQQVLVNIIKNAVEASMENDVVQIKLEIKGDQAEPSSIGSLFLISGKGDCELMWNSDK
jgi:phosphoglycerate-specific signal transduction histidine kinase